MAAVAVEDRTSSSSLTPPDLSSPPPGTPPNYRQSTAQPIDVSSGEDEHAGKQPGRTSSRGRPGRPRRKKEPESNAVAARLAKSNGDENGKKPRIRRGTGPRAMKKKTELEAKRQAEMAAANSVLPAAHQTKLEDGFARPTPPPPAHAQTPPTTTHSSQNGNSEAIHNPPSHTSPPHLAAQPKPGSGQKYDPIRSSTIQPASSLASTAVLASASAAHQASTTALGNVDATPPKPLMPTANRSPSILTLIDPPNTQPSYGSSAAMPKREMDMTSPPDAKRPRLSPPLSQTQSPSRPKTPTSLGADGARDSPRPLVVTAMDIDEPGSLTANKSITAVSSSKPTPAASKGASPGSHSPKPTTTRSLKDSAPLPSTGSGLLSGSVFGNGGTPLDGSGGGKSAAPTVVLSVPLNEDSHTINFTRLAEEKYGFNALHPRLAAQRDRLARVAAAGAALERAEKAGASGMSADDMSVDLSNDEGDASNAETGGTSTAAVAALAAGSTNGATIAGGAAPAAAPPRKKRVMKEDMYDIDDEFIDDTEQAWEEQAAVSKDGFFVYLGPLVPEGEEAKVERDESAPQAAPRRPRGGRRGHRHDNNGTTTTSTTTNGTTTTDKPRPSRNKEVKDYPGKPGPKKGWKLALKEKEKAAAAAESAAGKAGGPDGNSGGNGTPGRTLAPAPSGNGMPLLAPAPEGPLPPPPPSSQAYAMPV